MQLFFLGVLVGTFFGIILNYVFFDGSDEGLLPVGSKIHAMPAAHESEETHL